MSRVIKRVETRYEDIKERAAYCKQCTFGLGIVPGHVNHDKHIAMIGQPCDCGGTFEDVTHDWSRKIPGYVLVKCDCGETVNCQGFTSTCDCGRDYNWNGTLLAPRS